MSMRLSSLQKITELKGRMTQEATMKYSESLNELNEEQERLRELEAAHDGTLQQFHARATQFVSAQELHAWQLYLRSQKARIEQQNRAVQHREEICTEQREVLTDRFLDEQKWTRLKERRQTEHRIEMERISQQLLDEIAVTGRHMRG